MSVHCHRGVLRSHHFPKELLMARISSAIAVLLLMAASLQDASALGRRGGGGCYTPCYYPSCQPCYPCPVYCKWDCIENRTAKTLHIMVVTGSWVYHRDVPAGYILHF